MLEVKKNDLVDFWEDTLCKDGKGVNWEIIFDKYSATTDHPACMFWQDLLKLYPTSKVILTTREPDKWYKSMADTIIASTIYPSIGQWVNNKIFNFERRFQHMAKHILIRQFEDNYTRDNMVKVFNNHIKSVKALCPKEKLLKFEVKEGWKPLCDFLGKPIPDCEFPYENNTKEMKNRLNRHNYLGNIIFYSVISFSICGLAWLAKKFLSIF